MFQIVGKAGCLRGVIFTSSADGNRRIDSWLVFIWTHVDRQPIVESVDSCMEGVTRNRAVWIGITTVLYGGAGYQL